MTRPSIFAFLVVVVLISGCDPTDPVPVDAAVEAAVDAEPNPFDHPARVLRIVDGDTIEVRFQGEELKVRFLGIDTPEVGPPAEPWAEEAELMTLQNATPATMVGLEFDDEACAVLPIPSTCFDSEQEPRRLLAYIRTAQGYDLNVLLIAGGLARVFEWEDFNRKAAYLATQAQAQSEGVGIWSP